MNNYNDLTMIIAVVSAVLGGLWAYIQFVAKPAILAEAEKRCVSKDLYTLQNDYILKDLAEIKAEIKELKNTIAGGKNEK